MELAYRVAIVCRLGGSELSLHLAQGGVAVLHVVDGGTCERRRFLRHAGDAPVCRYAALAGIDGEFSPQQGEQAGLAHSIRTNQAHHAARRYFQADIVQGQCLAEAQAHPT